MKIRSWLFCWGVFFCLHVQSAIVTSDPPVNVKIAGISSTKDGEYTVRLELRGKEPNSRSEFVHLKPGESHGNIKLISVDPPLGEAKIQLDGKAITISMGGRPSPSSSIKVLSSEPKPIQTPSAKLTGMMFVDGEYKACLEVPSSRPWLQSQCLALKQGQREGDVEFVGFDPGTGEVKIRDNGQERTISWTAGQAAIDLKDISLRHAFDLWEGKGWTASSAILGTRISLRLDGSHLMEATLDAVKKSFQEKGIIFKEAGDKFILAGKPEQERAINSLVKTFEGPPTTKPEIRLPFMRFDQMPLGQVLDFYSEMVQRTVLRASSLPITTFISAHAKDLAQAEAIAAVEAAMVLNGFYLMPVGEKFIFVTTERQAETVRPIADKMSRALEKAAPTQVSKTEVNNVPLINFDNMRMSQVCEFYAELAGRTLNKDEVLPTTFVSLKSRTPLSKAEALAAMDAVLALNAGELVPDGETGLKFLANGKPLPRNAPSNGKAP